jgi:hypothetical protein
VATPPPPNPISSQSVFDSTDFPKRQMSYEGELVWIVATDDFDIANWGHMLLGKRKSAGDIGRCGATMGLNPRWPDLNWTSANIRLYVIAHGVNILGTVPPAIRLATARVSTEANSLTAENFFPILKDLVLKAPLHRVKRIALVMCNAGGVKGADATHSVSPSESFAQRLVNKCGELTEDITARTGIVTAEKILFPKADIDARYKRALAEGKTDSHKNPLQTVMVDRTEFSLTNIAKHVDGQENSGTYIFKPNKPPTLKSGYAR